MKTQPTESCCQLDSDFRKPSNSPPRLATHCTLRGWAKTRHQRPSGPSEKTKIDSATAGPASKLSIVSKSPCMANIGNTSQHFSFDNQHSSVPEMGRKWQSHAQSNARVWDRNQRFPLSHQSDKQRSKTEQAFPKTSGVHTKTCSRCISNTQRNFEMLSARLLA